MTSSDIQEPKIPMPPPRGLRDEFWRLRQRAISRTATVWARLSRKRCRQCGARPVYSWRGRIWPQDWLCESCTFDPDVDWR